MVRARIHNCFCPSLKAKKSDSYKPLSPTISIALSMTFYHICGVASKYMHMRIEAKQTYIPDGHAYGKIVSLGNGLSAVPFLTERFSSKCSLS